MSPFALRALFAAIGVLLAGLAIPLLMRRVPPNEVYGLRVPATLADEWVWYEANARSARWLLGLGILVAALALALPALGALDPTVMMVVLVFVLVLGVVGGAVWGELVATRLLRERQQVEERGRP